MGRWAAYPSTLVRRQFHRDRCPAVVLPVQRPKWQSPRQIRRNIERLSLKSAKDLALTALPSSNALVVRPRRDNEEDPRSAVRLPWQADSSKVKKTLSGAIIPFGPQPKRSLQWIDTENAEQDKPVVASAGGRKRRLRHSLRPAKAPYDPDLMASVVHRDTVEKGGEVAVQSDAAPVKKLANVFADIRELPDLGHRAQISQPVKTDVVHQPIKEISEPEKPRDEVVSTLRFPRTFAPRSDLMKLERRRTQSSVEMSQWAEELNKVRNKDEGSRQLALVKDDDPWPSKHSEEEVKKKSTSAGSVVVQGVSPSLRPSDFSRLLPPGLPNWSMQIQKLRQVRHQYTFEPLNTYQLSFVNGEAASAYVDMLQRLQRLGKLKLESATSDAPSQSDVEPGLEPEADAKSPIGLQSYTIAPPTLQGMVIKQESVQERRYAWTRKLQNSYRLDNDSERTPIVIVDVYPPAGFKFDLSKVIFGKVGGEWDMKKPVLLRDMLACDGTDPAPAHLLNHDAKVKGRYLIKSGTLAEARRFHRYWNNRVVSWPADRFGGEADQDHVLYTSILEW
ncbi:hypothetical protein NLU13_0785 [Sarocladium strictum]|uniref:Uncharacterized protein n=1 Tax=Sarocladium strictum TaxID=5046 RepID=A0AA39GRM5_SARSR|nr:hypothetical protein NLU13_0785 [Sarocladium strictum]